MDSLHLDPNEPEEESPPTQRSERTASVLALVPPDPSALLVGLLKELLAEAETGHVRGLVVLVNRGPSLTFRSGGTYTFGDMLASFEDWKYCKLHQRNTQEDDPIR